MVKISFIGDIGLNDAYIDLQARKINPFSRLMPFLSGSDLIVGNLECLVKGDQGENQLKRPRIFTTTATLGLLRELPVGLVSLATNHVYDHLEDGFRKTADFLDSSGISYIGAGLQSEIAQRPFVVQKNNLTFCFLNYITADTNPSLPGNASVYLHEFQLEKCLLDLRTHQSCDFRILLMHWGGKFEGGLFPDYNQIGLARKLVDGGADVIIGHHSHTFQPFEKYRNKYIFYSLGNFCFSDIVFEGRIRKMSSLRERESAVITLAFTPKEITLTLLPFRNENLILTPRSLLYCKLLFRRFLWLILKYKLCWNLYRIYFRNFRPLVVQFFRKDANRSLWKRIKQYKSR